MTHIAPPSTHPPPTFLLIARHVNSFLLLFSFTLPHLPSFFYFSSQSNESHLLPPHLEPPIRISTIRLGEPEGKRRKNCFGLLGIFRKYIFLVFIYFEWTGDGCQHQFLKRALKNYFLKAPLMCIAEVREELQNKCEKAWSFTKPPPLGLRSCCSATVVALWCGLGEN